MNQFYSGRWDTAENMEEDCGEGCECQCGIRAFFQLVLFDVFHSTLFVLMAGETAQEAAEDTQMYEMENQWSSGSGSSLFW